MTIDTSIRPPPPRLGAQYRRLRGLLFVGLLALGLHEAPPAAAQSQSHPWQTLMDAAVEANLSEDFVTAEALLKAALEVAQQVDASGPRPVLSRLLLQLVYADLDKLDQAHQMGNLRLDVSTFEQVLLPFARTLDRLANRYYTRWRELPNTEENRQKRSLRLAQAERSMLLKWAIQNKLLLESGASLATTIGFHGMILEKQGKLADAIAKYEAALKIWNEVEERDKRLIVGSQFSLFAGRTSRASEQPDDPLTMKILLARAYMWDGENQLEKKKDAEAAAAFKRAEPMFLDITRLVEQHWPTHPRTANNYSYLGNLYFLQRRYADSAAAYRRSLEIYEVQEGAQSDNTRYVVVRLAKVLRSDGRESEAVELETRYPAKAAGPK